MDIGIWGMGRMGFNMVRRLEDKGDHRVIAGNRSSGKVDEAVEHGAEGAYTVEEFVRARFDQNNYLLSRRPAVRLVREPMTLEQLFTAGLAAKTADEWREDQ